MKFGGGGRDYLLYLFAVDIAGACSLDVRSRVTAVISITSMHTFKRQLPMERAGLS